jgi:hypothetical protein
MKNCFRCQAVLVAGEIITCDQCHKVLVLDKVFRDIVQPKPIKSLAEFKRVLAIPGTTLTLREFRVHELTSGHRYLDIPRTVKKLQTNSFCLVTDKGEVSWVDFGLAANWTFTSNMAKEHSGTVKMVYEITKGVQNEQ